MAYRLCRELFYSWINGGWEDWLNPGLLDKEAKIARSKGLKVYAALDILGYKPKPRADVILPKSLRGKGDFTSSDIRSAYLQLVRRVAQENSPDYFVVLVEANLHKKYNAASYAAFKALYPAVVNEVHRLSPEDQSNYVQRLASCAQYAQQKGVSIQAINFTTLIDPSKFVSSLIKLASPALGWFCHLGLLDSDGHEKPAFEALKHWNLQRGN